MSEQYQTIIRKRYIPDECIVLGKDTIHHASDDLILTSWASIKPRSDISGGISAYYPKMGFKISKIFDKDHQLVHWYCDIIHTQMHDDSFYYEDLLLDVTISPDGAIRILDSDELADALEQGLITAEQACLALRRLNDLLSYIYSGEFVKLQQPILDLEKKLYRD